jgi:hypothetical protein
MNEFAKAGGALLFVVKYCRVEQGFGGHSAELLADQANGLERVGVIEEVYAVLPELDWKLQHVAGLEGRGYAGVVVLLTLQLYIYNKGRLRPACY